MLSARRSPAEGVTGFDDVVYGHIEVNNSEMDDQILIKTDGMPTYNFANVVDDHLMGITHVIRGSEYLSSTPKYNLLYQAFGWEIPTYIHCPPVMKDAQNKLSKRNGDASYQDLVAKGYLTEAVLNYICLLGWSPKGRVCRAGDLLPAGAGQDLVSGRHLQVSGHLRSPQAAGHQRGIYPPPVPGRVPEKGGAVDRQGRAHLHRQEAAVRKPAAPLRSAGRDPGAAGFL